MSDARAATDLQVQAVVALQEHLPSFMLDEPIIRIIPALCARIDADAARIRELEAALPLAAMGGGDCADAGGGSLDQP